MFEDFKLKWGHDSYIQAKPSDSIYPASSALDISQYVEQGALILDSDYNIEGSVQYAPRHDGDTEEEDFRSFFGGNMYRDKKVGATTVAYRVTCSSSSMMDSDESKSMDENENLFEPKRKCDRRQSW